MKIDYQIKADGKNVTGTFKRLLTGLSITDEAGLKSDTVELTLDDRGYMVELPKVGAILEIALGFREVGLTKMGKFTVDEISGTGPVKTLTIRGKAADMLAGLKSPKTRHWDNKTLKDIVEKIAGEHNLKPVVGKSLKTTRYAYLAQTAESDLHFLSRLAKDLDATVKPADGRLVFVKRGEGKTADGQDIKPILISPRQMQSWRWNLTARGKFKRVIAEWTELGAAKVHKVERGKGEPVHQLRHRFTSEDEAIRAADAALAKGKRGSGTISVEMGGFFGALFAEGLVNLQGIKPELVGKWHIKRVSHRLGSTLISSFEAERDNEK